MPPQIKRLSLLFVVFITVFAAVRLLLIPTSFGKLGHYRADSIKDVEALPIAYVGHNECKTCHADVVKIRDTSPHASLACETCHGPAAQHTEDPITFKPDKPKGRAFCGLCHLKNTARPNTMPQITEEHNEGVECYLCHKGHDPRIR